MATKQWKQENNEHRLEAERMQEFDDSFGGYISARAFRIWTSAQSSYRRIKHTHPHLQKFTFLMIIAAQNEIISNDTNGIFFVDNTSNSRTWAVRIGWKTNLSMAIREM